MEKLFPRKTAEAQVYSYFRTLGGYTPVYTSFDGGVYEMALTRACIHTFANHVSKLRPVVMGPGNSRLDRVLSYRPNPWMDTKKYLYRLATIYKTENTAFIAPVYDDDLMLRINGFFPVLPSQAAVVELEGQEYLRYQFPVGTGVVELDRSGIMTQMQYRDDFFGESNRPMRPTMELIHAQNQSIINGVKASGSVRFLAKLSQILKPEAMTQERDRLVRDNLSDTNGGVMIFDAKYEDVKAIDSKPYVVDDKQAAAIRESVFDYFGMSSEILHNKYTSDQWSAYYEGQIEPFAIEASLVHTNMTFSQDEIARGKQIIFSVNRLQHMTMADKLSTVTQLFDRGMMNMDEGREVFQLPELGTEDSKRYYIRRDYAEVNALNQQNGVKGDGKHAGETGPGVQGNAPADPGAGEQAV
ncbi:phage portal protein [Pseudoflavonifractor sp. DSM 107456]|uniref:Phage portal protein n=1 Tax=Pseudoflavonifractor gallinarum TaxID=2779352 RepID=A0ABR9R9C1_9FIRM|nr:phage portal protein [Pseudoflavonifractor gallinarum]MBE5055280.1 phage portal protein [Pseudoflavonifractor gallinarum]